MSVVTLGAAKKYLDVIHSYDDDKLQMLLDAAEDEALQFMDRQSLTSWEECCSEPDSNEPASELPLPASVTMGILILLQANYQAGPQEAEQLRRVAEFKLMPYRCNLGV